jgi:hypothetical protein
LPHLPHVWIPPLYASAALGVPLPRHVCKPLASAIMLSLLALITQTEGRIATPPIRNRAAMILTDIHFWVPALVLLGGLLLLKFLH